jgi:hypothetical protein
VKTSHALAVAVFFTITSFGALAQDGAVSDSTSAATPPAHPGGSSTGQGIGSDAAQAKQGIKSTARGVKQDIKYGVKNSAREVKQGVKSGARKVNRETAVAQCNDGRYTHIHPSACNNNGGVRQRFR